MAAKQRTSCAKCGAPFTEFELSREHPENNRYCRECSNARFVRWRGANTEQERARSRKNSAVPTVKNAKQRWREQNRERHNQINREWRKNNAPANANLLTPTRFEHTT